jgi:hypothetical protein
VICNVISSFLADDLVAALHAHAKRGLETRRVCLVTVRVLQVLQIKLRTFTLINISEEVGTLIGDTSVFLSHVSGVDIVTSSFRQGLFATTSTNCEANLHTLTSKELSK